MKRSFSTCSFSFAIGLLSAAISGVVLAAEAPGSRAVEWTPAALSQVLKDMPKADAQHGKVLHSTMFCASCHGVAGESLSFNWPSLSGQRAEYTYKMLLDYQTGLRFEDDKSSMMKVATELLTKQDMADLAAFYAAQPLPAAAHVASASTEKLIRKGDVASLVTPCASCHGLHGQGGINETPALAGLPREYFIRSMENFGNGSRHNDGVQAMRAFAKPLTREQISALADYYAPVADK